MAPCATIAAVPMKDFELTLNMNYISICTCLYIRAPRSGDVVLEGLFYFLIIRLNTVTSLMHL